MTEWLSVKVNVPTTAEAVLVSDGLMVGIAFWDRENLIWLNIEYEVFNVDITHWMPLPSPSEND